MEFRILKIDFYDPIKRTFKDTSSLDNLEISEDQLFDAYDIIMVDRDNKQPQKIHEILQSGNYFCGVYYANLDKPIIYINNKLEKCTYWNSMTRVYFYKGGCYHYNQKYSSRYTFFKDKLPCIFIDYYNDINYLKEYYKITRKTDFHNVFYMEEKGLFTKAALKK